MIESMLISLILTLIIELLISVLIGVRKKNDYIAIIATNILTNPVVVFIANVVNTFYSKFLYWTVVAILELIVFLVEGIIYKKILIYKKISGFKVSFICNVISFSVGLIIFFFINNYTGIKVEAASAFYPLAKEILESKNENYNLTMKSTNDVYEDIVKGNIDIAIATGPLEEQEKMIKESNVELKFKAISWEPLAIIVNKESNINNLTIDEIKTIYNSNNLKWNTYQLEENNGSQTCFQSIVKNNTLGNNHYEINTMPKIIDEIANDKDGIGYTFYSYYSKMHKNNNVKIIDVNGKSILDKDYPLQFEVYLIYRDNSGGKIYDLVKSIELNYEMKQPSIAY